MTAQQMIDWLKGEPLTQALWWFIENVSDDTAGRTEVFFYLRERMRSEVQS